MKNRIIYLIMLSVLFTSSCSEWLDVKPKSQMTAKEMFDTEAGFKDALMGCYVKFNSNNLYGQHLTMSSIDFLAQLWDLDKNNQRNEIALSEFKFTETYSEELIKKIYSELYNLISEANIVNINLIERGETVIRDEETRNTIQAEVLAIRAFCHFDVLRLFGQMPNNAVTKVSLPYAETVSTESIPYYSYEEYTAKIEKDLLAAEELYKKIGNKDFENTNEKDFLLHRTFRMNHLAVKALQARFYLYIGKKTLAYNAAKAVANATDKNGKNMFSISNKEDLSKDYLALPADCIFKLSNANYANFTKIYLPTENVKLTISKKKFDNDLFKGRAKNSNNRYTTVWNIGKDNQGNEHPSLRKYILPAIIPSSQVEEIMLNKQIIPLIRFSEMYLIMMETTESLSELNTLYIDYMNARNESVQPFTSIESAHAEIINEYRREFYSEGQMFYTYKRTGSITMLWKPNKKMTENDYILPLPKSEFNNNK